MKQIKKDDQIELRSNKIIKISTEEIEINKSEIDSEINMCQGRIQEAQDIIDRENKKLQVLQDIKQKVS